tara:strand:+ start:411 stop:545 length:135 start_codon:yes stop_codon:yes gene_type:complete
MSSKTVQGAASRLYKNPKVIPSLDMSGRLKKRLRRACCGSLTKT